MHSAHFILYAVIIDCFLTTVLTSISHLAEHQFSNTDISNNDMYQPSETYIQTADITLQSHGKETDLLEPLKKNQLCCLNNVHFMLLIFPPK